MSDEPFFEPLSEPEETFDEEEQVFDLPWLPPSHIAGVIVPLDVDVYRSDDVLVRVTHAVCYRRGFELHLNVWVRPGAHPKQPWRPGRWDDEMPRVGVRLADGTKLGSATGHDEPPPETDAAAGHATLTPMGGGSSATRLESRWWLYPPPAGDWLEVVALWDRHGMPESTVRIDLTPLRAAADGEVTLWAAPPAVGEARGGWFAYAPVSGSAFISQLSVAMDPEEPDDGLEPETS